MAGNAFAWSPLIALFCGVLAGLSVLRSLRGAFGLGLLLMLAQVVAWVVILMTVGTQVRGDEDWNPDLVGSFLLALVVVVPYTTIGAVLGAVSAVLVRRFGRWRRAEKR
jgi:hypothetical protein